MWLLSSFYRKHIADVVLEIDMEISFGIRVIKYEVYYLLAAIGRCSYVMHTPNITLRIYPTN